MNDSRPSRLLVLDLHRQYPTPAEPLVVLRGVSLEISSGDSLAILGPSGSGKSTLLHILGTLDRPTAGSVQLDDMDLSTLSASELAAFRATRIGFVFQDHHLLPQCTALENVLLPALARSRVSDSDMQRGRRLLHRVGLAQRELHRPAQLSGGERQRIAVARALMNFPQLLLCDEPTGNLDVRTAETVGELIAEVARETDAILIVVTHSMALAQRFHRRMQLVDGQLVPTT